MIQLEALLQWSEVSLMFDHQVCHPLPHHIGLSWGTEGEEGWKLLLGCYRNTALVPGRSTPSILKQESVLSSLAKLLLQVSPLLTSVLGHIIAF